MTESYAEVSRAQLLALRGMARRFGTTPGDLVASGLKPQEDTDLGLEVRLGDGSIATSDDSLAGPSTDRVLISREVAQRLDQIAVGSGLQRREVLQRIIERLQYVDATAATGGYVSLSTADGRALTVSLPPDPRTSVTTGRLSDSEERLFLSHFPAGRRYRLLQATGDNELELTPPFYTKLVATGLLSHEAEGEQHLFALTPAGIAFRDRLNDGKNERSHEARQSGRRRAKRGRPERYLTNLPAFLRAISEVTVDVYPPSHAEHARQHLADVVTQALMKFVELFNDVTGSRCNSAVRLLSAKPNGQVAVQLFAREGVRGNGRLEEVSRLDENSDFRSVFENASPFFSNNLDLLIQQQYANSHWQEDVLRQPSYRSTIVWPIQGPSAPSRNDEPEQRLILGFLSVDSDTAGAFDETLDVALGEALAAALFRVLHEYRENSIRG